MQSCVVEVLHLVVMPEDACTHQLLLSVLCKEAIAVIMTLRMASDTVLLTHPSSAIPNNRNLTVNTSFNVELCLWVILPPD